MHTNNSQRGFSTILIAIIALVVLGAGVTYFASTRTSQPMKGNESIVGKNMGTTKAGTYAPYDPKLLANAATGKVVLFFHAAWCPTCRALDADIRTHLNDIPSNVTILETDYDTTTALKQKYGVTTQGTFVEVDANGNQLKKWENTTYTLADLLSSVK